MNYTDACNILNLSNSFTDQELRKAYLLMALQYHPDKNKSEEATIIFQNIKEAYEFLINTDINSHYDTNHDTNTYSYKELINNFINIFGEQYKNYIDEENLSLLIECFKNKCNNFSLKILDNLSNENIIKLYEYIYKYADILNISKETLVDVEEIIKNKLKNTSIIILNTSLKNILNDEVYILNYEDKEFYVPLWQQESIFDISHGEIIVKCIPDLKQDDISYNYYNGSNYYNGYIDKNNNIHVKIYEKINNILKKNISINLGSKVF